MILVKLSCLCGNEIQRISIYCEYVRLKCIFFNRMFKHACVTHDPGFYACALVSRVAKIFLMRLMQP